MNRNADPGSETASVRPPRHVSFTDGGALVVTVPATLVRLLAAFALLVVLAAVPPVFAIVASVAAALPLGLVGVAALLASALFAPFAVLGIVAVLLE